MGPRNPPALPEFAVALAFIQRYFVIRGTAHIVHKATPRDAVRMTGEAGMQLLLSTAGPSLAFQRYESGPPLPLAAQRIPTSLCPAGSAASPAVLVYGSPDVVHDPELPALLLSALKFHAPPLYGGSHSSLPSAAGAGRFEVVQRQPPDLSNHTSEHQSAAYVIPFQGPEKMPYALAEGLAIIEVENTTKETTLPLASLRGFVSGGGNLVLLGNTGQERALGLIAAVLGQPHGCQPASARFRISTSAVDSSASSHAGALPHLPPGLPDVFMPLGAAGGEGGSVGLLTCPRHALYPSAVPLFAEVGAWAAGSASSLAGALDGDTLPPWGPATSVVSPGFVWARGRGRVVWLGATFDQHTPVDWVRLLAVAVTAPPRDLEGEAAAQPPVGEWVVRSLTIGTAVHSGLGRSYLVRTDKTWWLLPTCTGILHGRSSSGKCAKARDGPPLNTPKATSAVA